MRNQASFNGAASAVGIRAFGPFPPGTLIKKLGISVFGTASGVSAGLSIALCHQELLTEAEIAADGQFLVQSDSSVLSGSASIPAVDITANSVQQNCYLNEILEDRLWVVVLIIDNSAQNQFWLSLDVELPERQVVPVEVSRPSSGGKPSSASSRVPKVTPRAAVPLPPQSGGKPSPQPTPKFGR